MKKFLFLFLILAFILPGKILAAGQIDINTASLAQLDELAGIGPAKAQAIVNARPFSSVDDLLRVSGIGPATLQKIKDQGLACVNCVTHEISNYSNSPNYSNQTPNNQNQNTVEPAPAQTPAPVVYPSGIFINEILPNPQGADETDEWIELYNSNSSGVDLSGWQLQDTQGTITTYTISANTKILANGFLVFKRPETKIMLNNDGDGVNLLTPDKKVAYSVGFVNAPLGQSYNKNSEDWAWSTTLTPGAKNVIVLPESATKALPNSKKSDNSNNVEAKDLTADVSAAENQSPWFLFFTALALTIILASAVLIIKLKLSKHVGA